ncbi:GNAT family N-acetyltransferase [Clavibacter phaseoli]|nr:GNAT family protein [Clavibacter phaseoli]
MLGNRASRVVLARAGFTRYGLAPRYLRIAGEWQDRVLFRRLADDPPA